MTLLRKLSAALLACVFAAAAFAAEASPAGTWKWSSGRAGGAEQTLQLDYTAGKLTGTLLGGGAGPDTPISDASFKEGVIKFSVTREARGMKVTTRYEGKLEGNTIKGTSERPNLQGGGEPVKREWDAHRAK